MREEECKELYEYLLDQLNKLNLNKEFAQKIESLEHEIVLNYKEDNKKHIDQVSDSGDRQLYLNFSDEEEGNQTEIGKPPYKERLQEAIEIIKIHAVTIPLMSIKTKEYLGDNKIESILLHAEDYEYTKEVNLKELEYFNVEEINRNRMLLEDIINEVRTDGNDG